jgi:hypothetical protein
MKMKKSKKHFDKIVNVLTKKGDVIEVVSGLMKGYLGGDILIDTGNGGLYDHVVMGSAPGASLVLPASVPVRLSKPRNKKITEKEELFFSDLDVLSADWEEQIPCMYESARYPERKSAYQASESEWM